MMSNLPSVEADDSAKLRRFLHVGAETGTYQVQPVKINIENCQSVVKLVASGKISEVLDEIVKISERGHVRNTEALLMALAACMHNASEEKSKTAAYQSLPKVCLSSNELFCLMTKLKKISEGDKCSWGRSLKRAIQCWYDSRSIDQLLIDVTGFAHAEGWSHRDLTRLAHVKAKTRSFAVILTYVHSGLTEAIRFSKSLQQQCTSVVELSSSLATTGLTLGSSDKDQKAQKSDSVSGSRKRKLDLQDDSDEGQLEHVIGYLKAIDELKNTHDEQQANRLIEAFHFLPEHLPTWFQKSNEVWKSVALTLPYGDLLKSLKKLAAKQLLDDATESEFVCKVIERIIDETAIRASRVHPVVVLLAEKAYERGDNGKKVKITWNVNANIVEALLKAFTISFKNIEPTGKRYLVAIDVSGSMNYGRVVGGVGQCQSFTPALAASAMAMIVSRENDFEIVTFAKDKELKHVTIDSSMSLDEIKGRIFETSGCLADCSRPIEWALETKKAVDVFIVLTDCQAWNFQSPPAEALRKYRREMCPPAKLVICALSSSQFAIADPADASMLDIAGFDASTPSIIQSFAAGYF